MNSNNNNNNKNLGELSYDFGTPVTYTLPPAIFRGYIEIENSPADEGDLCAFYVTNSSGELELRCVKEVQVLPNGSAIVSANIEMSSTTESLTKIEVWDSSENQVFTLSNVNMELTSGDSSELITVNSTPLTHPFGTPETYTLPPAIFRGFVEIEDIPAGEGDVCAFYVTNSSGELELRCVKEVQVLPNGNAIVSGNIEMSSSTETLTKIEVWDFSENQVFNVSNVNINLTSGSETELVTIDASSSASNDIPVIGDLEFLDMDGFKKVYKFDVIDDDESLNIVVNNVPNYWAEYKLENNIHKIIINPGFNNLGTYTFDVVVNDGINEAVSKQLSFTVTEQDVGNRYSFAEANFTDISNLFNNLSIVQSGQLKFVSGEALTTGLEVLGEVQSETATFLNLDVDDSLSEKQIELELILNFDPIFLKYRDLNLVQLVEIAELTSFEPSRWAKEDYNSYRVVFQGYMRDIHINNGCVQEDFDAGICEDPHILTFGGNRLDLPEDENIYNMIDGLGLKINVKSQIIGDGSYAKYFYVNYNNEEFVLDIEDLELKEKLSNIKTKYHMLEPIDYTGTNFGFEKRLSTLIVKSTDGIMELTFNAETRGLLIKSRLNFT